jgi:ABC-type nickel/cobalt efflux system permease component RcnA
LLLAAVSLGRVGFGMALVTVFSLGLAGVLIAVGLLFIKGGRLLAQIPQVSSFGPWIPAFSALAIFGLGVIITIQAAAQI